MRFISAITIPMMLLCVFTVQQSHAFQQQNMGGSAAKTSETKADEQSSSDRMLPALVGSSSTSKVKSTSDGQSISIPGLGTVGGLPKMDFGLELLYGNKTPEEVVREPEAGESDDFRIRGSIKHRF